jgi:hypothetical protein
MKCLQLLLGLSFLSCSDSLNAADWQPAKGPLMTRWAKEVSPEKVHPEYPRPQMVRKEWTNLNGLWEYAVRPKDERRPTGDTAKWDGKILVPFCIESALSGVMKPVTPQEKLWYRRTFERPKLAKDGRLLLHFGAVDWEATVFVNGKEVGSHRGGYTPFSIDITDALKPHGEQEIVVSVWDPTNSNWQPRGKQILKPEGIWYTAVTGIWQTVWLEPVPKAYIQSLRITPNFDRKEVAVKANLGGQLPPTWVLNVSIREPGKDGGANRDAALGTPPNTDTVSRPAVQPWTPEKPFLYDLEVTLTDAKTGDVLDRAASYFGQRKIEVKKDDHGHNRLFLNNKPVFQYGPLDQGWWPDGLYTAPTDAALAYDVEITKKLGMNMCRKHVKVEPARWYYHCDRLGLLVWQDMPSGDRYIGGNDPDINRSAESEANFRREWKEIIDLVHNHPSVIAYVPFNEGWGQFKTNEILEWTKKLDPTRLVDGPSGWTDRGGGDMHDMHSYPGPGMFPTSERRASVLGEFGGLGLPMEGHLWWNKRNWGYRTYKTQAELQSNYETLMHRLRPLVGRGLAAAVYTQTTDVEGEVNGLMTYDREVIKLDVPRVVDLHKQLYEAKPVRVRPVVATSQTEGQSWRYTTKAPAGGWEKPDFDDRGWEEGPGGFGTRGTPGAVVRTEWRGPEIWLRRTFELSEKPSGELYLSIHHDENADVYINGVRAARESGYTTSYTERPISKEAAEAIRPGKNTIAVRCRQTSGGQYIDVGLVEFVPAK